MHSRRPPDRGRFRGSPVRLARYGGKNAQAEEATEQEPESEETQPDIEQLDMTQTESEEAAAEEETEMQAEPEAQPEKASEENADRGDKLRQIESLLRGKNNG